MSELKKIPITIEIHNLFEVEPREVMRAHTQLKIKVMIDNHQLARLILNSLDDLQLEDLNQILRKDGFSIEEDFSNLKDLTKNKTVIPFPPVPPPDRILKEGSQPIKPKRLNQ